MMASMAPQRTGLDPWLLDRYRRDYRSLVRLAALLVDDTGVAEEIVQDAFVAVARRANIASEDRADAYLRSAVLNGARSRMRRRRVRARHLRSVGPPPTAPSAEAPALAAEDSRAVMAALATLPTRQREVLVLRYYAELSEAEIAETLGVSAGTVKTHAHRGLAALESRLEDQR